MNAPGRPRVHGNPARADGGGPVGRGGRESGLWSAAFASCLLPILAGLLALQALGPLSLENGATRLALLSCSAGWVGAVLLARGVADSWSVVFVVLLGAVGLRLVALSGDLSLSDDVQRHVWEGGLLAAGVDPYAHAPDAEELAPFRERWQGTWRSVNHRQVPAAYPPLALLADAGLVALAGGPERPVRARATLRFFAAACDLLVCWPLLVLLRQRSRPLALVSVWAWSPLVALEFAGAAHGDAAAILCTLLALSVLARARRELSSARSQRQLEIGTALLAAGALLKLLPGVLLPFALRSARRPLRGLLAALLALALPIGLYTLLAGAPPGLAGLGEYGFRWESFNLVHRWIERPLQRFLERDEAWNDPRRVARALSLLLFAGLFLHCWLRRLEPERAAFLLLGGFLVLSPTLHPWYLAWIVPLLALFPALSWTFLLAAAPLLYWPLSGWRERANWSEPAWLWPALALPFLALLSVDLARARRPRP